MTLRAFLAALKTSGVKITLVDVEGNELIKFFSDGYESVESDILARTVKRFDLTAVNALSVVINNPAEVTPDTEGTTTNAVPYTGG